MHGKTDSLDGKIAVVVGAGNGIGRAIAIAFGAAGARVVCADIDERAAAETASLTTKSATQAAIVRADAGDPTDAPRIVATAVERFGGVDVLVYGAAVLDTPATVPDLATATWNEIVRVNLTGAFLVCKAAIPAMAARGGGSLILIASQLGRVASPARPVYCATKGALIQLAKVMAADHAAQGIRVNTLSPGAIETRRLVNHWGDMDTARERLAPKHLLNRLGRPDEIAQAALFLASDASSFMTGADLLVDGGYTAV